MCDHDDVTAVELYRERIKRHGAVLIASRESDFGDFLKLARVKVRFKKIRVNCRSLLGKPKKNSFVVGYLPPGSAL